jgi:hypothetical protein
MGVASSHRIAIAMVGACATLVATSDARACGRGGAYFIPSEGELYAGVGVLAFGVADIVFTVHDAAHAGVTKEHDVGWAKAETYVTVPQLAFAAGLAIAAPEVADVVVAFSAWPASLMVHGFHATNGNYGERFTVPVGAVGAMDVGLVGYWTIATAAGHPPDPTFGVGEFFTGLAQTSFGLAFAAQSQGHAARDGYLLSLVPLAMTVHGYFVAKSTRSSSASAGTKNGVSFFPSTFVQAPTGPAPGLTLSGAF